MIQVQVAPTRVEGGTLQAPDGPRVRVVTFFDEQAAVALTVLLDDQAAAVVRRVVSDILVPDVAAVPGTPAAS